MNPSELSDLIIEFEQKHNLTDNDLAFRSHLPVEIIHGIKLGDHEATKSEIDQIIKYLQQH